MTPLKRRFQFTSRTQTWVEEAVALTRSPIEGRLLTWLMAYAACVEFCPSRSDIPVIPTPRTCYPVISEPEKTSEMLSAVSSALTSLSEELAPARSRPNELAEVVGKFFAAFDAFTRDAWKTSAQLAVWCE